MRESVDADLNSMKEASKRLRGLCPSGASQEQTAHDNPHPSLNGFKSCESAILNQPASLNYERCSTLDPLYDVCCEKCLLHRMNNCTQKAYWEEQQKQPSHKLCRVKLMTCGDFNGGDSPCFNGGKCEDLENAAVSSHDALAAFKCQCKKGFKGRSFYFCREFEIFKE